MGATNEFEGFDIDVGNKIAEALGVKAEFVPTETAQRVPFLVADRIDISLGALTRSSERAKLIDYTVPLHTEAMGVLTTDKVAAAKWTDLDTDQVTLVNMRGNWSVDFLKEKLPKSKVLLVETNADTVRALAQGRADALVENIDFFMAFTKNYPDVKWRTLDDTIFVAYCAIGIGKGNAGLQNFLNILLYELHSTNYINEDMGEVVRRADDGEGRAAPVLLIRSDCASRPAGAFRPAFAAALVSRGDELHLSIQRGLSRAALSPGRGGAHAGGRLPVLLAGLRHRPLRRARQSLWRRRAAPADLGLRDLLHQHAGAGADLLPVLRAAGPRHPARRR